MPKYKVESPIGNIVVPKNALTEQELREFVIQIISDSSQRETWLEKANKDPIESVVDWLITAGYKVKEKDE